LKRWRSRLFTRFSSSFAPPENDVFPKELRLMKRDGGGRNVSVAQNPTTIFFNKILFGETYLTESLVPPNQSILNPTPKPVGGVIPGGGKANEVAVMI